MNNDDALDALIAKAKRHDAPPQGAEHDAWVGFVGALGSGGGGGGGESATPAPTATAEALTNGASALGLAKALAALALVGAVGLGVSQWTQPDPSPSHEAPTETRVPLQEPPPRASGVAVPLRAVAPAPKLAPQPRVPTATPETTHSPRLGAPPQPAPSAVPVAQSTLAVEARLVGSMWKAIDRGDAAAALPLAAQHRTQFPDGELRLEAQAAGAAARCILGRPINLTELQAIRRGASKSVANRLAGACGEDE